MAQKIPNNTTSNPGTGSGVVHRRLPFGHITVFGGASEVVRISAADLYNRNNTNFQGIWVQSINSGTVKVEVTLADLDIALSPEQDGGGHWVTDVTLAANAYQALSHKVVSALRITFNAAGTLFIAGV